MGDYVSLSDPRRQSSGYDLGRVGGDKIYKSQDRYEERTRHERDRERDRDKYRDRERYRDRGHSRERGRDQSRDRKYEKSYDRERGWEKHRESHRDYQRRSRSRDSRRDRYYSDRGDNGKYFRDGGNGSGYRRRDRSPIALFDKYSTENLSPYRGVTLSLEDRQKILNNWDAAPPGFERISADKAKLTGLFPPPGNIAKITNFVPPTLDPTKAAMLAMLTNSTADAGATSYLSSGAAIFAPALAKQARRVYVGGIPTNCNEDEIADYFNQKMNAIHPSSMGQYVLGVEISGDRDYAFVDLRSPEEAELACRLNETIFRGHTLAVRRTREFSISATSTPETQAEPSENNQLVVSELPLFLTEAHLKYLLAPFGQLKFIHLLNDDQNLGSSFGIAVLELDDPAVVEPMRVGLDGFKLGDAQLQVRRLPDCVDDEKIATILSLFSLTPGKATSDPTSVMQLLNMVTIDDLTNDEEYANIVEDIEEECSQFGEIVSVLVPRPNDEGRVAGIGKIFVEFKKVDDCMRAVSALSGRTFADRTVLTSYYPPEKYHKGIL